MGIKSQFMYQEPYSSTFSISFSKEYEDELEVHMSQFEVAFPEKKKKNEE